MPIHKDIRAYNASQSTGDKRICDALAKAIDQNLPDAENKIWHRHPVWFLEGNPIVGYSKLKDCIRLLFWSGQSFDEADLKPEGSFQAAEARYTSNDQMVASDLKRWLKKAIEIQWDYKNIVKRKGKLERLKAATVVKKAAAKRVAAKPTLTDWRGETLAHMRALILEADSEMIEEVKWRKPSNAMAGVPVWSHHGIVCTGETYSKVVKFTFAKGASLPDPSRLFNSSLEGNTRRAIDVHEGEKVNAGAFKMLIKAAVAANTAAQNSPRARRGSPAPAASLDRRSPREDSPSQRGQLRSSVANSGGGGRPAPSVKAKSDANQAQSVNLLSGGNPQIAKADGDTPVQAYIAAMPGWKRDVGRWLDELIERTVPNVQKAVRWNTPFYGIEGQGWFLGIHCITKYVKVAFFQGTSLRPLPPVESKQKNVRYLHIHEGDPLDEKLVASWIRQASELPGEALF